MWETITLEQVLLVINRTPLPGKEADITPTILAERPYRSHPDDAHLIAVLCYYRGKFVTWVYNASSKSFAYGHYFVIDNASQILPKWKEAFEDFNKR